MLPPLSAEAIEKFVDFDAREEKKVPAFDIDPTTAKVARRDILDNEIIENDSAKLTLLNATPFAGLTIVQHEPDSLFTFSIGGQRFKGHSYLLRLEADGRWIAPLAVSLSAGDVKQHITFNTLDAAAREANEPLPTVPNEGFEQLDATKIRDYFDGLTEHEMMGLVNQHLGLGTSGHMRYPQKYEEAGLQLPGGNAWHIAGLREAIGKAKTQRAETEARLQSEGFVEGITPQQLWGDFTEPEKRRVVMCRIVGLAPDASDVKIAEVAVSAGFRQWIGERPYTNLTKLKPLVDAEIAKVQDNISPITHEEFHPADYAPPGFEPLDDATLEDFRIPAASMDELYDLMRSEFGDDDNIDQLLMELSLLRMVGSAHDQPFWNALKLRVFVLQILEQLAPSKIPHNVAMGGFLKFSSTSYGFDLNDLETMLGGKEKATAEAKRLGLSMTLDGTTYWHVEKTIAFYYASDQRKPSEVTAAPPVATEQLFAFENALQEPPAAEAAARAAPPSLPVDDTRKAKETAGDPDYEAMSYEDRDVADRALHEEITGSLQLAQRQTALARRELQSSKPDDGLKPLEIALAALSALEKQVATLVARLGSAKSERLADVVGAYLHTDRGQMTLYPKPEGIDEILRAYAGETKLISPIRILNLVLTTSKGDVTLPSVAEVGDADRDKVASTRRRPGKQHTTH